LSAQLGIEGRALTGTEFAALSDAELDEQLDSIGVVARVAPEDKVRLVDMLKRKGNVVSMTGDGVNDAPALKRADIGVAMGITGTEVTKEAADMILTDDNFATIVSAVEGGRAIYDNLMKYVRVQLIMLGGFILTFVGAGIFDIAGGTPLTPLQILWINFAVDVVLAIGLGFDAAAPGLMQRTPRDASAPVVDRGLAVAESVDRHGRGSQLVSRPKPPRKNTSGPPSWPISRSSTRPTTIQWSPASCTASISQSTQANTSCSTGAPVTTDGRHPMPANLSSALLAKTRASSSWSSARMLTQ